MFILALEEAEKLAQILLLNVQVFIKDLKYDQKDLEEGWNYWNLKE